MVYTELKNNLKEIEEILKRFELHDQRSKSVFYEAKTRNKNLSEEIPGPKNTFRGLEETSKMLVEN